MIGSNVNIILSHLNIRFWGGMKKNIDAKWNDSLHIPSFSGLYFPAFGLNKDQKNSGTLSTQCNSYNNTDWTAEFNVINIIYSIIIKRIVPLFLATAESWTPF